MKGLLLLGFLFVVYAASTAFGADDKVNSYEIGYLLLLLFFVLFPCVALCNKESLF
jgi:hypothetical protein